jgi:hypothetical protein
MDLTELWSFALRLNEAWWEYGDPYAKERYLKTHDRGAMAARKILMRADLLAKIWNGDYLAIAIRVSPNPGTVPEIIPSHHFSQPDFIEIDWQQSSIRAFGHIYEGVKVVAPPTEVRVTLIGSVEAKREGRPPVGSVLREIVQDLETAGQLDGISRKEQETRVRRLARQRLPRLFPKPNQPSRPTILKALREQGFGPSPGGKKSQ